jgi:hypothetical protein
VIDSAPEITPIGWTSTPEIKSLGIKGIEVENLEIKELEAESTRV